MKFLFLYLVAVFLICMAAYVGSAIFTIPLRRNTKRERVLRLYRQAELIARRRMENE